MSVSLVKTITKIEANPLLLKDKNEYQIKKVAAYCRVSTDDEEQLNSYNAQISYYTETIAKNPSWSFVGIYADEGITGTDTKNRKEFLRLMKDCEKGKVDMVLTKSISRFARNTVDSLTWVRRLRAMGIGVFFEEQGIDSLKTESEMLIGLFSVLAQSESENIGANVRWGIRQSMKSGTYCSNFKCFGYDRGPDGVPIIVEEQAQVVRKIFELFIDGMSVEQICIYLEERKIKSPAGKTTWHKSSIQDMLKNEKYVGDLLLQKTYIADTISKKTKLNNGELPKYLISNNHPPIVDRDTYYFAQTELARRNSKSKKSKKSVTERGKYSGKYALTDLLICGMCGSHYRRTGKTKPNGVMHVWRCIGRIEHRCKDAIGIEENKLHGAICRCLSNMLECKDEAIALCQSNLQYALTGNNKILDSIAIENQIKIHQDDIDLLMEQEEKTTGDPAKYEEEIIKQFEKIKILREQLLIAKEQAKTSSETNEEIDRFLKIVKSYDGSSFSSFDNITVRRLVECIKVNPNRSIEVVLKSE